jgi:hypothetical protein
MANKSRLMFSVAVMQSFDGHDEGAEKRGGIIGRKQQAERFKANSMLARFSKHGHDRVHKDRSNA